MFYILSAIILWSSLGVIIRLTGIPVHLLIFFSCLTSSIVIGSVFSKKIYGREFPHGKWIVYLLVLGIVSFVNTFSFFYAYKNTTIANAVLTHYTAPVIVAFLSPFFLKERLSGRILASVAIATSGLWIMLDVSPGHFYKMFMAGDKNTAGIFAGLLSGAAYAILVLMMRTMAQRFHPFVITFFQNTVIAFIILPFAEIPQNFASVVWIFVVIGIVHSTIAPFLYARGMREVSANKTAILGYLEPVCSILLGVTLLNETLGYSALMGGAMILFSGYLTISE